MQVDESSSEEESEDEVCTYMHGPLRTSNLPIGRGILYPWFPRVVGSQAVVGGIFTSQVGFPIGGPQIGAYCLLCFRIRCRAQKRVAQQRLDSKMPLGRIIDIRKKVFAEVKVSSLSACASSLTSHLALRVWQTLARRSETTVQSPLFASLQIANSWRPGVGLGM